MQVMRKSEEGLKMIISTPPFFEFFLIEDIYG
jgi:hypothetical protein